MATNQPMNLLEWQLHCVLKRANLLQYYESFVREGECDVLKLSNAEDEKFHDIMEKVGMARKPLRIRQLRNTLLEWINDQGENAENQKENQPVATYEKKENDQCDDFLNPNGSQIVSIEKGQTPKKKSGLLGRFVGFFRKKPSTSKTVKKGDKGVTEKNEDVPTFIKKTDDDTLSTSALKSSTVSEFYPWVQHIRKDVHWKHTKEEGPISTNKLEKKTTQKQENTRSRPTQRVIKDQKQHGLFPYYDELINLTVLDKNVLDNLISRCILMIEDREEIIKPTPQRERNKVLLDILTDRPYDTVEVLKDVLKESDPHNSDVQELISRMQCTVNSDDNMSCYEINVNDNAIRIQKNYTHLVNNIISTTDVTDYLIGEDTMQHEEREEVCANGLTKNESNRRLLDKLLYKDGNGYHQLLKALRHAEYLHIAHEVSNTAVTELDQKLYRIGITKFRDRQDIKEENFEDDLVYTHGEVIPRHILEQFKRRLQQWKEDDKICVSTAAEKEIMKSILTEGCITIVGNSGTGKSFLSRHVALMMMEHDYIIMPCDNPGDIRKWFEPGRKTLFVFDDVCGRYTLNQQIYNEWKQRLEHIQFLLKDNCCKIISTCNLNVYKNEQFSSLSIFKTCMINLSTDEFRFSAVEKFALAEVYFKENAKKATELLEQYDFFPLLCSLYHRQKLQKHVNIGDFFNNPFDFFKNELVELYREGKAGKLSYCSLVLCVIFNNTLTEEKLCTKDKVIGTVIEDLLEECELNKGTPVKKLKKSLETLDGTFIVKEDRTYKIIHDKMFDFLAKYFGEIMLQLFIYHAEPEFICERFLWKTTNNISTNIEFAIRIPDNIINIYIERLLTDWENGYVCNVSDNINMNSTIFTEKFLNNLNKLDHTKQEKLASTQDVINKDIALTRSCSKGTIDLVNWLIRRKSDINYCSNDGWFPLLRASYEGHVGVVQVLLQNAAEVNKCNSNGGESSLHMASQNGHVDVVIKLLQHSATVNKCTNKSTTPLFVACNYNSITVVRVLLQSDDVDIDICDSSGRTSLYIASQEGHVEVVKELLQHSAEVNKCENDGVSPLLIAIQNGHGGVVDELLQYSADVNQCKINGVSPLFIASQQGYCNGVKELLQHSAQVNQCKQNGFSPLYIASQKGHTNVVQILLQHAADVNLLKKNGASPLYIASQNGHITVVRLLLQNLAGVNKCCYIFNQLHSSCYCNWIEVEHVLLQCDDVDISIHDDKSLASKEGYVQPSAGVDQFNNNCVSPLYIASQEGHVNVVKELLQHSAEVNHCDNNGTSPLLIASQEGHVGVVKELLQHAADVNHSNNKGVSSLYIASQAGHVDVIKELLHHLVNINDCDYQGKSPLTVAQEHGHSEVELLLLRKGANQH